MALLRFTFLWMRKKMLLSSEEQGSMVFHILEQGYHQPFVDGKANRDKIEDQIVIGMYKKEIPPLTEKDVDWICYMIDIMIEHNGEIR